MSARRRSNTGCHFNEAGAINAGKLPVHARIVVMDRTSMRPAQLTPENCCRPIGRATGSGHFNEAGAINAGKLRLPRTARPFRHNFNEAGAINAGKPAGRRAGDGVPYRTSMRPAQLTPENFDSDSVDLGALFTSMRPAQLTPENRSLRTAPRPRREYFNEAGAINAGKPERSIVALAEVAALQ